MARDTLSALIVLAAVLMAMFAPLIKDAAQAMSHPPAASSAR